MASVLAPISIGELFDKITILEIKKDHLINGNNSNIQAELDELLKIFYNLGLKSFSVFLDRLREVNTQLWDIEDSLRKKESEKNFGDEFIQLARDVYITNDKRFEVKNKINNLLNSEIKEVKTYESYS